MQLIRVYQVVAMCYFVGARVYEVIYYYVLLGGTVARLVIARSPSYLMYSFLASPLLCLIFASLLLPLSFFHFLPLLIAWPTCSSFPSFLPLSSFLVSFCLNHLPVCPSLF